MIWIKHFISTNSQRIMWLCEQMDCGKMCSYQNISIWHQIWDLRQSISKQNLDDSPQCHWDQNRTPRSHQAIKEHGQSLKYRQNHFITSNLWGCLKLKPFGNYWKWRAKPPWLQHCRSEECIAEGAGSSQQAKSYLQNII